MRRTEKIQELSLVVRRREQDFALAADADAPVAPACAAMFLPFRNQGEGFEPCRIGSASSAIGGES